VEGVPVRELQHFGGNLKYFRQLLGLSQHDLAGLASTNGPLNVTQTDVSKIESGWQPRDSAFLECLARALRVTPADLVRRPRIMRSPSGLRAVVIASARPDTAAARAAV
jgi:transcriptional regulator with XRE-family HTH domain